MPKVFGFFVLLSLATWPVFAKRKDVSGEGTPAQIAKVLRQTKTVSVSCGDDADLQTCKFFMNALSVALHDKHVTVLLYNDPEVMIQSFYVPPRLLPYLYVTLRLIEDGQPQSTTLYVSGFCFDPDEKDMKGTKIPMWSQPEKGSDTGPMEADKAQAASSLAKEFAVYWMDTTKVQ